MRESVYEGLIGLPYAEDGRGPDAYNCGELSLEVLHRAGYPVPRPEYERGDVVTAARIFKLNESDDWEPVKRPYREFDLIVMRDHKHRAGVHCGTFVPPNRILHTAKETGACCVPLRQVKKQIVGVYRYRCRS